MSAHGQRVFGFGFKAFKKYPELIPLCAIMGVAMVGCTSYAFYSFTKLDVIVNKKNALPPWERVDLNNPKPQKFLVIHQKYEPQPELAQLKKDISE